jgi:nicotinamidase/pyrazinamidase
MGPAAGDALIVIDVQVDFLPGGALAVARGDEVVPVLNDYMEVFRSRGLPVVATRDWHPPDHCSFREQGGPWPPHCVAGTPGAGFAPGLALPADVILIYKDTLPDQDDYSVFVNTGLDAILRRAQVGRLFIGGLATDYCVRYSVLNARQLGYRTVLLTDAIHAVEVRAGDGERAIADMLQAGAVGATLQQVRP